MAKNGSAFQRIESAGRVSACRNAKKKRKKEKEKKTSQTERQKRNNTKQQFLFASQTSWKIKHLMRVTLPKLQTWQVAKQRRWYCQSWWVEPLHCTAMSIQNFAYVFKEFRDPRLKTPAVKYKHCSLYQHKAFFPRIKKPLYLLHTLYLL